MIFRNTLFSGRDLARLLELKKEDLGGGAAGGVDVELDVELDVDVDALP